jgi:hypothetical protein
MKFSEGLRVLLLQLLDSRFVLLTVTHKLRQKQLPERHKNGRKTWRESTTELNA